MNDSDPDKEARAINSLLADCVRRLHALLEREGLQGALLVDRAGVPLQLDQLESVHEDLLVQLAEIRGNGSGFAPRIRPMTRNVDDWSTTHNKVRQLDHGAPPQAAISTEPLRAGAGRRG